MKQQQRKQRNIKKKTATMSSSYYYDPETNWKLDWPKVEYYKKLFKTNCMSRSIDRTLKKQQAQSMQIDLDIVEIYMQDKIQAKIINKLQEETNELCNNLETLKLEYDELKDMLNEVKMI